MTKLPEGTNYLVVFTEYERGWGSKDFHATPHKTYEDAKASCDKCNAKNNEPTVPDYYIIAKIITNPEEFKHYERLL